MSIYQFLSDHLQIILLISLVLFFFFNDTATTEIYTLSLHDALPILPVGWAGSLAFAALGYHAVSLIVLGCTPRSEEHTSELQSRLHLVCRLLLEKKKKKAGTSNLLDIFEAAAYTCPYVHRCNRSIPG